MTTTGTETEDRPFGVEGQDFKRFTRGDRVRVVKEICGIERKHMGREFTFLRYSGIVGYAVVKGEGTGPEGICLYPESLKLVNEVSS